MAKYNGKPQGGGLDNGGDKNNDNGGNDDFTVKHRFGTVDATAFEPTPRQMYFGSGNSPDNYNAADVSALHLETGLKIHLRTGSDIPPVGSQAGDGTEHYVAPAGLQPGNMNRAAWNFDYVVDTAVGSTPITTKNTLGDFTFKVGITQSGPFLATKTVVYDLNAATHFWVSESNPTHGFGGDDFSQPGASALLKTHLAENSVNLGFLISDFGPLATSTAAGVTYDIKLSAYHDQDFISTVHDIIVLA